MQNGRPHSGWVFQCWKGVKKLFRKTSRWYSNNVSKAELSRLLWHFKQKNMNSFWNIIKRRRHRAQAKSNLTPDLWSEQYSTIMTNTVTDNSDKYVTNHVNDVFNNYSNTQFAQHISTDDVAKLIDKLHRGCSPGMDGVSSEHLIYGKSKKLFLLLSSLFSTILSRAFVPECFYTGVIIPILKKSTLDPNRPENYRPITLSSIYSKLIESIIIADIDDNLNDYQFGFRSGRSTAQACNIINDTVQYFKVQNSPVYMCALDAEKCFDSINHISLLYKLINVLQANHWLLIHKWYSGLRGVVRWDSNYSCPFRIYRGTIQGSLLSPYLFNVFINGLNNELEQCNHGIAIGDFKYNNVTYADDITLVSSTITGLQVLIDTCVNYSTKWHFKFNVAKSKYMTIGKKYFSEDHTWHLGPNIQLVNGNSLDILGVSYVAV